MKSWVWIVAVADTEDQVGTCLGVYKDRPTGQTAFREALKRYGGNRRYDVRFTCVTSVDSFLNANPQYRPLEMHLESLPA